MVNHASFRILFLTFVLFQTLISPLPSISAAEYPLEASVLDSAHIGRSLLSTAVTELSNVTDALALLAIAGKSINISSNVCKWTGVKCTGNRVTRLVLQGFVLEGPLSEAIGSLDQLYYLDLSSNLLNGSIPSVIGNLTKLTHLDLSSNEFTGVIPLSLGNFENLTLLNLGGQEGNELYGTPELFLKLVKLKELKELRLTDVDFLGSALPPTLENWSKLSALYMDGCNLAGSLKSLENLTALDRLDFSNNFFFGPLPSRLPSKITDIVLARNELTGTIPDSWASYKGLSNLILGSNQLSGSFPSVVLSLTSLSMLSLASNQFSGPIPETISKLKKTLTSLDLSNNSFDGRIPSAISDFMSLAALSLSHNKLSGTFNISSLSLETLELQYNNLSGPFPDIVSTYYDSPITVDLSGNQFSGELPDSVFENIQFVQLLLADNKFSGPIPKIDASDEVNLANNEFNGTLPVLSDYSVTIFNVSGNRLSGKIPSNFLNADSITALDLSDNPFTGPIPSEFGSYKNISAIVIRNTNLSGPIPATLLTNVQLSLIDLRDNQLTGPISITNAVFPNVATLYLGGNKLNGTLPATIGNSKYLIVASLENNQFSGSLPSFWSRSRLSYLNLSNNALSGSVPPSLGNLQTLVELDLDSNSLNGSLPSDLGKLTSLKTLRFEKNFLSGELPVELGNLTKLLTLDLSSNSFSGALPPQLSGLSNLVFFNVSSNYFTGSLPGGNLTKFSNGSYLNNTATLCGYPLTACPSASSPSSSLSTGAVVGIAVGCASFGIILLIISVYLVWHLRKYGPDGGELVLYHKLGFPISYRSILEATENFGEAKLLGVGGFGSVYRATLGDGQIEVAIKRLAAGSGQGLKELRAETKTLGSLRHRNLVTLIGSYISRKEALLIYEFISGGDLDSYLNGQKKVFSDWQTRHYVLVGTARGFKYLHHDCAPAVIHRDIKPANILLDSETEPRIADFGLAKELDIDTKSHLSTAVSGTVGYLAPEYVLKKRLTTKSDVYAFGVVILQILTGRKPTDKSIGESGLAAWVSLLWIKRAALDAIDPTLKIEESEQGQILGALKIGLMCTSRKPSDRPSMAQVVHLLENLDLFSPESMGEVGEEKVEKAVH